MESIGKLWSSAPISMVFSRGLPPNGFVLYDREHANKGSSVYIDSPWHGKKWELLVIT